MDIRVYLDHYLDGKTQQRAAVFADAASTSVLMHGVQFLCQHFYHLFDWYCFIFMLIRLRIQGRHTAKNVWKEMGRLYADAIDTYHMLWVVVTCLCYSAGWWLYPKPETARSEVSVFTQVGWWICIVPAIICAYRVFEILAALVEIYFRPSDTKHHQFRILLHACLHYLCTGFAFALFYVFADWSFDSFSSLDDAGTPVYQLEKWFDPIYYSMMTVVAFSVNDEPQNWLGELLTLIELAIGFMLATFIFMNITQIWTGSRKEAEE